MHVSDIFRRLWSLQFRKLTFYFRDLQEIGIVSTAEQKHLIDQARLLHASKTRPVGYSQRCEMSLERGTIIGV